MFGEYTRYTRYIQNTRRRPGGGGPARPRRGSRSGQVPRGRAGPPPPPGRRLVFCIYLVYLVYICIYLYIFQYILIYLVLNSFGGSNLTLRTSKEVRTFRQLWKLFIETCRFSKSHCNKSKYIIYNKIHNCICFLIDVMLILIDFD